jgi:plasmid stability protein
MQSACTHVLCMAAMIQIRNVPDDVHRTLKVRAAQAGMSLSEFLLREVIHVAERPTLEEVLQRIEARGPAQVSTDSAAAVRAEREARG